MASHRPGKQRQPTQLTISTMGKVSSSIRLEIAVAAAAVVAPAAAVISGIIYATAAVSRECDLLGRLNNIRWLRALVAELADKVLILSFLRSCQAQSLILIAQRLVLLVLQVLQNTVGRCINRLEGVAVVRLRIKAVLHIHLFCVAEAIGNLLRQIPASALNANVNILNCRSGITAAGSQLCRQVACVLRALIAQSADSVVNSTEIVVKRIVQRGEYVCDAVGLLIDLADKSLLVNGGTDICLCSTRSAATIAAAVTIATAGPISTPAEQQEDNQPNLLS